MPEENIYTDLPDNAGHLLFSGVSVTVLILTDIEQISDNCRTGTYEFVPVCTGTEK